ncbi:MAG: hypothetical protein Fur0039_18550 [Rhodocyclaceae bacterium]
MPDSSALIATLSRLEPVCRLSPNGIREIARACKRERAPSGAEPFRECGLADHSVYLLRGELLISWPDGSSEVLVGASEGALQPLGKGLPGLVRARAITDIELVRIDDEVLDVLLTWDQMAAPKAAATDGQPRDWRTLSGIYAAQRLTQGIFAPLPPANIEALLGRFRRIEARRGEVVVRQGDPGDHYYVIDRGRCEVTRRVAGATMVLAELAAGDGFGEEALLAGSPRNATVTMKSDGVLLRLEKADFATLLREPLLHRIAYPEACARAAAGAVWVDVRFPAEYHLDRMPEAINIPLNEVRNALGVLDAGREYIVYCQSGRRSSVAAFLMSQHGLRASLLEGGLRRWAKARAAGARIDSGAGR